jgi:hypothetical protein
VGKIKSRVTPWEKCPILLLGPLLLPGWVLKLVKDFAGYPPTPPENSIWITLQPQNPEASWGILRQPLRQACLRKSSIFFISIIILLIKKYVDILNIII